MRCDEGKIDRDVYRGMAKKPSYRGLEAVRCATTMRYRRFINLAMAGNIYPNRSRVQSGREWLLSHTICKYGMQSGTRSSSTGRTCPRMLS